MLPRYASKVIQGLKYFEANKICSAVDFEFVLVSIRNTKDITYIILSKLQERL